MCLKVFLFHLPLTVQCFAACRHFDYTGFFGCAVFCFESNVWWFVPIHVNYLTSHDLSLIVHACMHKLPRSLLKYQLTWYHAM